MNASKFITLLIALCTLWGNLHAQTQNSIKDILDNELSKSVSFSIKKGFLLVDIKFANLLPMKFIFDTGSSHTILFDKTYASLLHFPLTDTISLYGADMNKQIEAYITRSVPIALGDDILVQRDLLVLKEDKLQLQEMLGEQIHGIIGGSFFKYLVLELNYKKKKIYFHDPDLFVKSKKHGHTLDIEIKDYKPYITTAVASQQDTSKDLKLLLDTGAALSLMIHLNTDQDLMLPDKVTQGFLGKGLSGDISGFIGKTNMMSLGPYDLNDVLTSFQDIPTHILENEIYFKNGLIGNILLSRFNIVIDYLNFKLHIKPLKKFNRPFKYDKSGLIIFSFGKQLDKYFIKDIIKGSPADLAGLEPGDIIHSINRIPVQFMSLNALQKKLQRKDGKQIKMVIKRNEVRKKINIKLKDYL